MLQWLTPVHNWPSPRSFPRASSKNGLGITNSLTTPFPAPQSHSRRQETSSQVFDMAEPTKICPYSLPDLKNTSDDAVAAYLKTKSFAQSHTLTDVRLSLSTAACLIAGATFYLDYTQGFEKTKTFTLYACIAYFTLNTALTIWLYFFESSTIYVGKHKTAPVSLTISSKVAKHDPTYRLKILQTQVIDGKKILRIRDVEGPFMNWIDDKGFFVKKPFESWLGASVPWILENEDVPKELDSGVVTASGRKVQEEMTGVEVGSGKGSVRRKGKKV
ncbi:hypothetical protein TWF569_008594 [Orbilia oligospora]|nr:hypothetical protein TWF569_008594 [Orbilia oligospora]